MKKLFLIGMKDIKLAFRDRAALILMLAAPFVLTLGLGFVTGSLGGNRSSGLSEIPVVIVNQDKEALGDTLVEVFQSSELSELVEASEASDPAAARSLVDEDEVAAAIIVPAGFTRSIIPEQQGFTSAPGAAGVEAVKIEIYANPTRPTSAGIIEAIVAEFNTRVDEMRMGGMTAAMRMMLSGRLSPDEAAALARTTGERMASQPDTTLILLKDSSQGKEATDFNPLAFMAPGMAMLFLMYTVTYGGRTILLERSQGTLPRLMISPTRSSQVLGGKSMGIYLTGVAQLLILIGASSLLFRLEWGDPIGVMVLVLAAVYGATGWGLLITAISRSPAQVSAIGSAIMLTFGILGGSFISLEMMPPLVQALSKLTPNAWALDGFTTLALGGELADILRPVLALLLMGSMLFVISVVLFRRKNVFQR